MANVGTHTWLEAPRFLVEPSTANCWCTNSTEPPSCWHNAHDTSVHVLYRCLYSSTAVLFVRTCSSCVRCAGYWHRWRRSNGWQPQRLGRHHWLHAGCCCTCDAAVCARPCRAVLGSSGGAERRAGAAAACSSLLGYDRCPQHDPSRSLLLDSLLLQQLPGLLLLLLCGCSKVWSLQAHA